MTMRGGADYNLQLSKKRAEAVRDALIATGKIDPTHINTCRAQNQNPVGYAANW
jgi:outer membrane protein OmpA-like peptidoglycan-associated protein